MSWNFQKIQKTTRQISGQISNVSLTNPVLNEYINNYYQFDLPRDLKIEELYVQHQFALVPGQPSYDLPGDFANGLAYTHVEPRIYINGLAITYTQDTNVFYSIVPKNFSEETIGIGDGVTLAFGPYTTKFHPIYNIRSNIAGFTQDNNILITDGLETFHDVPIVGTGNGSLVGDLGGAGIISYTTGVLSLAFNSAPANGARITTTYHYQTLGSPNTALFYARQFTFYPTPDTAYQCRIDSYQQPQAMVNPTDTPEKEEWAELIACGAALKILRDFGQTDKYQEVMMYYNREKTKCMSDTDNQYMSMRAQPRW
jgi:hypothetical protein